MTYFENNQFFDWQFYIDFYPDLRKAGINTQEKAYNHYKQFGIKENRRTHQVIKETPLINSICATDVLLPGCQIHVSKALHMFEKRICDKFDLVTYNSPDKPAIFFGVYTNDDLYKLAQHRTIKYIIWGGEDANPQLQHSKMTIQEVKWLHNTVHIAISDCIYHRLASQNIASILVYFNLVNTLLFKPVENKGKCIFIFNGQTPGHEHIYGGKIYTQIVRKLPNYDYIYSNSLNKSYEEMPKIYSKCFIMLRLTSYDGNANSVQECAAMNIPVVHNQSTYGLKWQNVDDIIAHILQNKP